MLRRFANHLKSWEGLLLIILVVTVALNVMLAPQFLTLQNQVNLFQLSIEKIILALVMTFIIINGEIDLSVASIMGLVACMFGVLVEAGVSPGAGLVFCLLLGAAAGAFNAFWITRIGIPSLVVTLAMLIGYRGFARVLLEDRGISSFPAWFGDLGQKPFLGPFPLGLIIFVVMLVILGLILHRTGFGRQVYVIGNNAEVARFSGLRVNRVKATLFILSGFVAALSGLLYAARLASVRGDAAFGFELDIITMVLLGGVSIFGGKGTMPGVLLAILIVLNLRNGMALVNITGHVQTGIIGLLLIASVLVPNLIQRLGDMRRKST
ncbi:MAG: ABC transporter permease [Phyllobacteriaceae bacterium]|nr:ABC transporter permease [Phyllobacteriaceae bacterium]